MPKPLFGDNGSGMHTHQSLWKAGKPLFAGDMYAGLSQMALWYIGGLAEARPRALGDHRAHHQQLQAPGAGLRSAGESGVFAPQPLGRVPHPDVLGQSQGQARRVPPARSVVRIRYLAFAAMMMAGLDGVLNKIDPGEPLDKDIYDLVAGGDEGRSLDAGVARRSAELPRRRSRLPAQGRRVQRRTARNLHRLQAQERSRRRSACARIRTSSRCTTTSRHSARNITRTIDPGRETFECPGLFFGCSLLVSQRGSVTGRGIGLGLPSQMAVFTLISRYLYVSFDLMRMAEISTSPRSLRPLKRLN